MNPIIVVVIEQHYPHLIKYSARSGVSPVTVWPLKHHCKVVAMTMEQFLQEHPHINLDGDNPVTWTRIIQPV